MILMSIIPTAVRSGQGHNLSDRIYNYYNPRNAECRKVMLDKSNKRQKAKFGFRLI